MRLSTLEAVTEALDVAEVPFILVGGVAVVAEIAPGRPVRIVRLETLLRLKDEAGRPQDLADAAELRRRHGGAG